MFLIFCWTSRFHKQPETWIPMLDENNPEEAAESRHSFPWLFSLSALSSSCHPHDMGRESQEPISEQKQLGAQPCHNCQLHGLNKKSCPQRVYLLATVYTDFKPGDTVPKRSCWYWEGIMKLNRERVQRTTAIPHHCTADISIHFRKGFLAFYQNSSTNISFFLIIIMIPLAIAMEKKTLRYQVFRIYRR